MRTEVVYFAFGFSLASMILRVAFLEAGLSDDFAFILQILGLVVAAIGGMMPKKCSTMQQAHRWFQDALRQEAER